TGTRLGDPIEIQALTKAFAQETDRRGFIALGSVKSNIGHLDTAAGVSGLIKTVLSLTHREIVPSLHYNEPNPEIDFAQSPLYATAGLKAWPQVDALRRRAGVSSFGSGGTNVPLIREEAPPPRERAAAHAWLVLPLSAKSEEGLERATADLLAHLEGHPE